MDKIGLIVFDVDGTFYDLADVAAMVYKNQKKFLMQYYGYSEEEAEILFSQNNIKPGKSRNAESCTELFERIGIDRKKWSVFREENFDAGVIKKENAPDEGLLINFSKTAPLVILSSNSYGNILKILHHLGLPPDLFKKIFCPDNCKQIDKFSKTDALKLISSEFKIPFKQMLSIGDRINTDIIPMLTLGGRGVVIESPKSLKNVLDFIQNDFCGKTDAFQFYNQAG